MWATICRDEFTGARSATSDSDRRVLSLGAPDRIDMSWQTPAFSPAEVNRAGRIVVEDVATDASAWGDAYNIITNWRAAHAYPLNTFQITLRSRARKIDTDALVSQRTKRIVSIRSKLQRYPTMKLSQIQDIVGCRAVMPSLSGVRRLADVYEASAFGHKLKTKKDYLIEPKPDGYRSVHLVYRYIGTPSTKAYDGLHVEVQLRSRQQHAWATAVETAGTFTGQALKSNQGSEDWLRFFALMSSVIAEREKCEIVPGTPKNRRELLEELSELEQRLQVVNTLRTYGATVPKVNGEGRAKYFLILLRKSTFEVNLQRFPAHESQLANEVYTQLEREIGLDPDRQVVLVSVESIEALRKAYPSFFLDTARFVRLVQEAVRKATS